MEILIREWKENKYHNIQLDICIIYYFKLKLYKINKNIWAPFCHFYFLKWYVILDIIFHFLNKTFYVGKILRNSLSFILDLNISADFCLLKVWFYWWFTKVKTYYLEVPIWILFKTSPSNENFFNLYKR